MASECVRQDSKIVFEPIRRREWESTVTIPIDEATYNSHKSNAKVDIIFLFDNGSRLAARRIERKITVFCRNLLSFYHNQWFPIRRTQAIEDLCRIDDAASIVSAVHRIIVYHEKNLRVSYNKEECDDGVRYNVEYEIEYPENSEYQQILFFERQLMMKIINDSYVIQRSTMTLENIFSCVMSKVQMWHCFDMNSNYIWAYKWNGVKAKMMITEEQCEDGSNLTYIWPDAQYVKTERAICSNINLLKNLCFLVELMDDGTIVIIEAIGTLVDSTIFTTEPMMNASILKYLKENIVDLTISGRKVRIQEFYPAPMPEVYDINKFDGFIIIQNDMVIKWKAPTVDVKCIGPYTYTVCGDTLTLNDVEGEVDKIYEMSWSKLILRERTDRKVSSGENEYRTFLKSVEYMSKNNK